VSLGTIGFDAPGGSRIGVLPTDPTHLTIVIVVGILVLSAGLRTGRPRTTLLAVSPLLVVLVPWLPFSIPSAFLIWTGAMTTVIWVAVGIALAMPYLRARLLDSVRSRALMAGVVSFIVFSIAAWGVSPSLPGGDEPHYLVITQSLLYDGDLKIENNHRRGDYHAYFAGNLNPDSVRHGRNGEIYSIHAPGVPALVLPAFAIGGYHGVVIFLLLLSSAGCALAWWLAWRVTGSASAAWFGWAAVALSPPFLLESFTVYPDGPGATIVLTGFWALLRADWERERRVDSWKPWMLHGVALAVLPWMHTRLAVLAATLGGLILVRLARGPNPFVKAAAFLTVPALSALAWLAFFLTIYGTPDPSAPYAGQVQSSFAFVLNGAGGLLFDQGFGLLACAPVLVLAVAGFRRVPRLAVEWLIVATPYLLAVTTFAMWWAGWSGPARFFVPLVLPLAIPAACGWAAIRHPGTRASACAALVVTAWLSATLAAGDGGRLGYHNRNEAGLTAAPWIEWAIHPVDVPSAAPAFVPLPVGTPLAARDAAARSGFIVLVPWLICLGAVALALRVLAGRALKDPTALAATTTIAYALAITAAVTIAWKLRDVPSVTTVTAPAAQMDILRRARDAHVLAVDLSRRERIAAADLASRVRIMINFRPQARGLRVNQSLVTIPSTPAGRYLVTTRRRGGDGWMMVGIGVDQFSLVTQPASQFDAGVEMRFPVDVRTLVVRADEDARQHIDAIEIHPLRVLRDSEKLTSAAARRGVRYDASTVFFLDDRAFVEPSAFWVGGARETSVVIAPDRPGSVQPLLLRNALVQNTIALVSGEWRVQVTLAPGEERRVDVPLDPLRGAALVRITSTAGFRPSEADPTSRDTRYLGVYVKVL
jgi:hypothetical protein